MYLVLSTFLHSDRLGYIWLKHRHTRMHLFLMQKLFTYVFHTERLYIQEHNHMYLVLSTFLHSDRLGYIWLKYRHTRMHLFLVQKVFTYVFHTERLYIQENNHMYLVLSTFLHSDRLDYIWLKHRKNIHVCTYSLCKSYLHTCFTLSACISRSTITCIWC